MSEENLEEMKARARQIARDIFAKAREARVESKVRCQCPIKEAEILSLQGSELVQRVYERLRYISDSGALQGVTETQQSVYSLFGLDAEVTNGGFHQFLWNSQALTINQLTEDAALIKGTEAFDIIAEAARRAERFSYKRTWLMRKSKWWWMKQFQRGYTQKRFDDLDERYFSLSTSMMTLLADAIKRTPDEFTEAAY